MRRVKLIISLTFFLFALTFFGLRFFALQVSGQGGGITLSAPNGVTVSDGNYADKIGIMWNVVRGANNYRIFRGTTNDPAAAAEIGATPAGYFFDTTAAVNQNYFYWVRAENGSAASLFSGSENGFRASGTENPDTFLPPLNPPPSPTGNEMTAAKAALGKALFWDEQMSSTLTVSCGTCHRPGGGGSDPRTAASNPRSRNPGFDNIFNTADDVFGSPGVPLNNADGSYSFSTTYGFNEQVTGRKAPSYLNAGYSFNGLFWDGRATDEFRDPVTNAVLLPSFAIFESQAVGPPVSAAEMGHAGRNWTQVAAQIAAAKPLALAVNIPRSLVVWINGRTYPQLFEEAFGTPDVTPARIAMAIAAHERTLFSDQTPLDKWSAQIAPLTAQEERGRQLFRSSCTICHAGGALSSQRFHYIGVRPASEDPGRANVTGDPEDNGRFKVPNLRNVQLHAPYMHNGRFATLEEVVDFYDRGGDFDAPNLDIDPLGLSTQQKADLVAFLKRPLTDQRVVGELPPFDRPKLYTESTRFPVPDNTGRAGAGGILPKVTAIEPAMLGNTNFTIGVTGGLGGANAVLVIQSTDPGVGASIPSSSSDFPSAPVALSGVGNGGGWASINFSISNPDLIGRTFYGRWYITDAGAANGFSVSNSFRFTVFAPTVTLNQTHADFDGDAKTDLSIFRPSVGEWWYLKSISGGNAAAQFGVGTDKITPGDFTGDGKTDIAFWRPSTGFWYVLRSEDFSFYSFPFGATGDVPAPADFDADGKTDAAVFRPTTATWYIFRSRGGTTIQTFGQNGDVPQVGDYDGDGIADIAIFRPSNGEWWLNRSSAGTIAAQFGAPGDKPVAADYTGDGKKDVAIFRPSSGEWFVLRSEDFSYYSAPFGIATDLPSPGDYDGDGKSDFAVFRGSNTTWYLNRSQQGYLIQSFGSAGDYPVPAAYVP